MWNSCLKFKRLKKVFVYRNINPKSIDIDDFAEILRQRGITDNIQNDIVSSLLVVLEPPACTMTHCKLYGGQGSFCHCIEERIPGKCSIFKGYKKRQREKAQKEYDWLLQTLSEKEGTPIDKINLRKFSNYWDMQKALSTKKYLEVRVKKWGFEVAELIMKMLNKKADIICEDLKNQVQG